MPEKLADMHLADLHARAAELGVPRYRLLRRDDLVTAVSERGGDAEATGSEADDREPPEREAKPERKSRPEREAKPERERLEEAETEEVNGVLEITPQRYG